MANILFWNTKNNESINEYLKDIIIENDCDLVVLAEYASNINSLCNELSIYKTDFHDASPPACDRIRIICKSFCYISHLFDTDYYSICTLKLNGKILLLVTVHLPSKLYANELEQQEIATRLAKDIEDVEKQENSTSTIIVGDFNSNPFEGSLINANCLHSVPCRKIAQMSERKVMGKFYKMFYNPMWSLMGDSKTPVGTYFYNSGGIKNYFWNIFDQVLLRPTIAYSLDHSSLRIISASKSHIFTLENNRPNPSISDHLPIFFKIIEENIL